MIGGTDYVFRLPPCRVDDVGDMVIRWAKQLWPAAWFETDEMARPVSLAHGSPDVWLGPADEFFLYQDEGAAAAWTELGATDSNRNQMLHVLVRPKYANGQEESVQVTVVVDELTPEMRDNLQTLQEKLQAEAASRWQFEEVAA